jgi:hypothetical protein
MYLIICLHRPFIIIAVAINIVNCANYPNFSNPIFSVSNQCFSAMHIAIEPEQ